MTKKALMKYKKKEGRFDLVYEYIFGQDHSYPSFKVLYNSKEFSNRENMEQLKKCFFDFLLELREVGVKEKDKELDYFIDSVLYTDMKKLFTQKCRMIEACNSVPFEGGQKIIAKHVFYKVKLAQQFILELEKYDPIKLDEPFEKKGIIHFFKDERLNTIIEGFNFNPDHISIFNFRQIEYGIGDKIFKKIFDGLVNRLG